MSETTQRVSPFVSAQPHCNWQVPAQIEDGGGGEKTRPSRVFISYKRNSATDERVAEELFNAISRQHYAFIDKTMLVGTDWAVCIESKIRESDFLITLLSAQSVNSEMVKGEIEKAHVFGKESGGRPAILPVRLAYHEAFPYSLSPYLNPLQWANWECHDDTPRLIRELLRAISGKGLGDGTPAVEVAAAPAPGLIPQPLPSASLKPLELPEGTMDPQSEYYIVRRKDSEALAAIRQTSYAVTIPIKGPRQMGKSSLLLRVMEAAAELEKQTVLLDFQLFDHAALSSADTFYRQFCVWLTMELGKKNRVDEFWNTGLGNNQKCTSYMSQYLLQEVGGPLVLAMDEVERIFDTEFRDDFFSMLRSWHNKRAREKVWKQCDLVLVTSTEPYQLINNLNQSPFNVGVVIELEDFSREELRRLNALHGRPRRPFDDEDEERLMKLLNGHPYLVRRALYLVANRDISTADLFARARDERGPFGDHLRYHLFRMHDKEELVKGMCEAIKYGTCTDERIFFRLRGAGLVRKDGKSVRPRCQLYAEYFGEHLNA